MTRKLSDKKQNVAIEKIDRRINADDDEALKAVMGTYEGRRFIARHARDCGWLGSFWDSQNARQTDFNAGRQSAATTLMEWAERVAPEDFMQALSEATARNKERATLIAAATTEKQEDTDDGE